MSRVLDKIGSVEDALNQKLASFETQLLELRHLVPSPMDGVGEKFGVTSHYRRKHVYGPYSGLAPSEGSCGKNVVLPQRGAPLVVETGCSRGRRSLRLFGRLSPWTHVRPPSHQPHLWAKFLVEPACLPGVCSRLFRGTIPGYRGENLHGCILRVL